MRTELYSISRIFTERLFRIPDYQRGYAWGISQLKDFWSDIQQLENEKNHYVGVLTLEPVVQEKWRLWEEDKWIIESKNYDAVYIVDGQQRLTTIIILLQVITELVTEGDRLNYTSIDKIKEKFIFETKDKGLSRSYIFGYEKDNPSYEFLKRKIFLEDEDGYRDEETIYTSNLEYAKEFFKDCLSILEKREVEIVYKKITQHLLFNIYYISSDIDVFVTFETMNNRGKPLSNLELLKNRLIYLSTRVNQDTTERNNLRRKINDSWKAVYHYLGKNKTRPLNDDFFLKTHFVLNYIESLVKGNDNKYSRQRRYGGYDELYSSHLLGEVFTLKRLTSTEKNNRLDVNEINKYINSLQQAVKNWYNIFNPTEVNNYSDEEKLYLDKLSRLRPGEYSALILAFYIKTPNQNVRVAFLKLLEKYAFVSNLSWRYGYNISYHELASKLQFSDKDYCNNIIKVIESSLNKIIKEKDFVDSMIERFKGGNFYDWNAVKYFLFEYELSLKEKSKTKRERINWREYIQEKEEHITVEHIYPQKPTDEAWTSLFKFHYKQNEKLCNSLGNLLALSKPKNASLQNNPFLNKVDNGKNNAGYRYGSYSEIEVSKFHEWNPECILNRGIKLLEFMEERWAIKLGTVNDKVEILGLSFLKPKKMM